MLVGVYTHVYVMFGYGLVWVKSWLSLIEKCKVFQLSFDENLGLTWGELTSRALTGKVRS